MVPDNWHFSPSNKRKSTTPGEGCPISIALGSSMAGFRNQLRWELFNYAAWRCGGNSRLSAIWSIMNTMKKGTILVMIGADLPPVRGGHFIYFVLSGWWPPVFDTQAGCGQQCGHTEAGPGKNNRAPVYRVSVKPPESP